MIRELALYVAVFTPTYLVVVLALKWLQRKFLSRGDSLALDIKNLEGESAKTTVEVAGGSFEVEYHPHAASRQWQTNFGRLQREQQQAVQDDEPETELEIQEEITEEIQKLIVGWKLEYDGAAIPVSAVGLDMLSMPVQQALFQGVLTDASGGDESAKKRKKRRSRRGSS